MLHKTMQVLDLYSTSRRELGVSEAAELLHRPKSTISRWLADMASAGFLDRDATTGRYRISMRLAALGELARIATPLQRMARPILEKLTESTAETSNLTILDGHEAVNIEVVQSPQPVIMVGWVGRRFACHATAAGKVLLAWQPSEELRQLLPSRLERHASATITARSQFETELAAVRHRGYATAWAEFEEELAGVAAPVRDYTGRVIAAVAIGAPTSRVPRSLLATLAEPVMEAAGTLSTRLGYR